MSMPSPPPPFSLHKRVVLVVFALVLLALLVTAARLEPSSQGYGTHQKLGLGECFVVQQWGVRCPSCGMTTAWARLLNGDLPGAVAANPGGVMLCIAAMAGVPWLLASAAAGQWCYLRPTASLVLPALVVVALVVVFDWMRHTGLALLLERIP